ncbi:Clp protease ClpS [Candidatus Methylacidiphilum fumarolicum]|uniref:ATP-dependent Clp protease adapter protein ClpS n=4 Tax=Methylacidiphilaceae TaxID=717964 RepID=A0A0C1V264_9BACT|nr:MULTISPECIES: ATP-dependent Clp protease adapter ClpS [Methylacidiphilum (ex Ratnadevi et al. 2023)]KIE57750.1 Clp protease ClpS [Methylacidiphilum kamchatkense Kam1]QDQ42011.1 ATP-dependent Clp protease adaptor protein ClpS [Methylacidiphilum kamchatkense Kam1]TFE65617.1 Clp protease ClpS [Candidatus Methylacidiphilum fumarolicum]TFE69515.1 Clp protease ClpS [Methylacidiphilum sp. Yel]TFE77480.1 Clp protease ClpS [Candidatus Methylacidiphilum fumarolicum]
MAVEQLTSPDVIKEESVEEKVKEAFDQLWGVIVWNDPINLMSYVVYVFQRVLKMSKQDATRHMLEVHNKGKSMVAKETKEKAELLVHQLQGFGLQATMEKT